MDTGEFCRKIEPNDGKFRSRVLVIPSCGDFQTVADRYGSMFEIVRTSDFVSGELFFPMPERVFAEMSDRRRRLREYGKQAIVIGLDGYLSFLNPKEARTAFDMIAGDLNGTGSETVVYVFRRRWEAMDAVFTHPSIFATHAFCEIGEPASAVLETPVPVLVGKDFATRLDGCRKNVGEFLRELEGWGEPNGGEVPIAVQFNGEYPFAGLAKEVRQYPDLKMLFAEYCRFSANLSDGAFKWICANTTGVSIDDELSARFFPGGTGGLCENVLSRHDALLRPEEKEVFLYVAGKSASQGSYLSFVIAHLGDHFGSFVERYVNASVDAINSRDSERMAEERQTAIRNYGIGRLEVKTAVLALISKTRDVQSELMKPWLRLGLDCEAAEWTRRFAAGEDVLSETPLLNAYLSDAIDIPQPLRRYFSEYRTAKIQDAIDAVLCESAIKTVIPDEVMSRSSLLSQYSGDGKAALLVIDAMGGEYLDFLCARLREHGFCIQSAMLARANLPTSTPFNPTREEWGNERFVKFDEFDKLLHKANESHIDAISRELAMLDAEVMGLAKSLLDKYERIVLTADHGASRLAVVARRESLSSDLTQLANDVDVEDWRYASIRLGKHIESDDVVETLDGKRCSVKGYCRFPRPGAPGFEMHGGATPEELLVPFVVIARTGHTNAEGIEVFQENRIPPGGGSKPEPKSANEQMREDGDFNI